MEPESTEVWLRRRMRLGQLWRGMMRRRHERSQRPGATACRSDPQNCADWKATGGKTNLHPKREMVSSHASGFARIRIRIGASRHPWFPAYPTASCVLTCPPDRNTRLRSFQNPSRSELDCMGQSQWRKALRDQGISERTAARLMPKKRNPPSQTWRTFLDNHVKDRVSIEFFVVPTATFQSPGCSGS